MVSVPLRGMGWESTGAEIVMRRAMNSFRPLAGNGLGKSARKAKNVVTSLGFPSPCGEWVGKECTRNSQYERIGGVSVPLRGMGWESRAHGILFAGEKKPKFPSPCGEWVGKDQTQQSSEAFNRFVSVPLRGMGWESQEKVF